MEKNIQNLNTKSLGLNKNILFRIVNTCILGIGLCFIFTNCSDNRTIIETVASKKSTIELPDKSTVILNALSSIKYLEKDWESQRSIALNGEAYFKVAAGKKFDIHTTSGTTSVLGTQFNVKQREQHFEVTCYEGVVSVTHNEEMIVLRSGDIFTVIDDKPSKRKTETKAPDWVQNRNLFYNTPYNKVLQEIEWQYGVTITTKNINPNMFFTGNFTHSNIQNALRSITTPMNLKYSVKGNKVVLFK